MLEVSTMSLEIRSTSAQIGINRTPANLEIRQAKADLQLDVSIPQVRVEGTLPRVKIDQSKAFSESGRMSNGELTSDNASYSKQKALQGLGRVADQGNQMTEVHTGQDAIAAQSFYNAYDQFLGEFNMVTMPRSRPEITVIEGELDIQVEEGRSTNNSQVSKPEINYTKGKVEIYVKQKKSLSIRYLGENVDRMV